MIDWIDGQKVGRMISMTTAEVKKFIKRIKAYYPYFSLDSEEAMDEWFTQLRPYDSDDVNKKLDEHLRGEKALEPPKLHFITRYIMTKEEKEKAQDDYIILCNICGKEMSLTEYDTTHYDRCLMIKTLVMILNQRGEDLTYEDLDVYDTNTLDRLILKYLPIKKEMDKII